MAKSNATTKNNIIRYSHDLSTRKKKNFSYKNTNRFKVNKMKNTYHANTKNNWSRYINFRKKFTMQLILENETT